MLIKSLSLKEFKCFEQVDIDFGKITLLTGANSSGKSSLINALLGIMQSKYFPQYFALNGDLVNMGGFDDVLRRKAYKKQFEVDIEIKLPYKDNLTQFKTVWTEGKKNNQPHLIIFFTDNCSVIYDEDGRFKIDAIFDDEYIANSILSRNSDVQCIIEDSKYHLKGSLEVSSEFIASFFNISSSDLFMDQYLYSGETFFNYIGSYRLPPERTYYRKSNAGTIGVNGDGYIDQIIEWEEEAQDDDDLPFVKHYQNLINIVSQMGLFSSIESNKMKGGRFELNIKVNENSALASLTDVGFGISQFLPIIVADLQLSDESCLAVSQPEIHLHPKIQATLGDYFAKQVKETEKQYIVETHSEYLINRLRLLIVKGELQPEDVKLYYMENDGDKTTTYPIELTTDGQIKNAPQGFFDTYEMDVMDIALFASAQ